MSGKVIALAAVILACMVTAQTRTSYTPPRTPDGQPDLQGVWTNITITPLERPADLAGKILIDVANPLDFSGGMPPTLTPCNTDSLGESLQREFPNAKVVKTLNTCNCKVMVDPARVPGEHDLFICGNDAGAKDQVRTLLREFGWTSIIDLGDITNARAT